MKNKMCSLFRDAPLSSIPDMRAMGPWGHGERTGWSWACQASPGPMAGSPRPLSLGLTPLSVQVGVGSTHTATQRRAGWEETAPVFGLVG